MMSVEKAAELILYDQHFADACELIRLCNTAKAKVKHGMDWEGNLRGLVLHLYASGNLTLRQLGQLRRLLRLVTWLSMAEFDRYDSVVQPRPRDVSHLDN